MAADRVVSMSSLQPSPTVLKYLFGQHILNGIAVAAGVGLVAAGTALWLGFSAGMAAGTGAVCVSIGDNPSPLVAKRIALPMAWALATAAALAVAAVAPRPLLEGGMVVALGLLAGLLLGYGRWAQPHSVLTLFAVVLTLGMPASGAGEAMRHVAVFAAGGAAYVAVALLFTWALDASSRRLALGECLREFAAYLRVVGDFYTAAPDLSAIYGRLVEQQASLVDHLQAARNLIFSGRRNAAADRLAESLALLLEALDALVSTHADFAPLRQALAAVDSSLLPSIESLFRLLAGDLDRLAVDLLARQDGLALPDRQSALAAIAVEAQRLVDRGTLPPREARALRATRTKLVWLTDHLAQLPIIMGRSVGGSMTVLSGIDLDAFVQPLSMAPGLLGQHLNLASPVLRHAIRLALAMGSAYAVTRLVPAFDHGNWILLTVAVVLRANHSATRRRRDERLIGNLIGCLGTAALLRLAPPGVLMAVVLVAVGVAHAYTRVHYLVTATAACVMALLSLHFLDPVTAPPVLARLLDTLVGAAIAYLFSMVLARHEEQDAPQLVHGLQRSLALYADRALRVETSVQSYRLARKRFVESLAAVTESVTRMRGEAARVRRVMAGLAQFSAAAYLTGAQIVGVRLLTERRRQDLDPALTARCLDETRHAVLALLDPAIDCSEPPAVGEVADEATLDVNQALILRCAELRLAAGQLRDLSLVATRVPA